MLKEEIDDPKNLVARNLSLTGKIMKFLMDNPTVFNSLPKQFELVILPEDDPDIRQYNLELLDRYGSEGRPIVFARLKTNPKDLDVEPSIFIPVPVAA